MHKSILLDILNVLLVIRNELKIDEIENFILNSLLGEILDKKSKKQIKLNLDAGKGGNGSANITKTGLA